MFKRKKVAIEISAEDYRLILESLVQLRNRLLAEGRYTDAVDEMLEKLALD